MCDANLLVMQEWRRGKFRQQQKQRQPAAEEAWERKAVQTVTQIILAFTVRVGCVEVVLHVIVVSTMPQVCLVTGHCVPVLLELSHMGKTIVRLNIHCSREQGKLRLCTDRCVKRYSCLSPYLWEAVSLPGCICL